MNDAGEATDSTSMRTTPAAPDASPFDASVPDAAEPWDGCVIADAGGVAQDGAYGSPGWSCTIPDEARSTPSCQIVANQYQGCGSIQYALSCAEEIDASSLGCRLASIEQAPTHAWGYCCYCEGADAGTGCVNVDPSTYDRSCTKDSDCMFIWSGSLCPGGCQYICGGGNTAINVDSRACYEQALAPMAAASLDIVCHCPNWSGYTPVCVQGVCTVPNSQ